MDVKLKTLSFRSAALLKHFNDLSKNCFLISEAQEALTGSSREAVKKLLRDMVGRGLLFRLKEGTYWIIPYKEDSLSFFPNWHLAAKCLVGDPAYYIGYYSALNIHSLITQPALREQTVVNKQIKPSLLKIKHVKFQFIYHNPNHFFGWKPTWIDSYNKVNCSDLEKTFIDCLYKPDYGGGIVEIAKALYKAKDKIDYTKLLNYCSLFQSQPVIKRLGFLLELLNIETPIIDELRKMRSRPIVPLEPSYEKNGEVISRWSIQQNIETQAITSPIFS